MTYKQILHDLFQRGGYRHWCVPKVGASLRWYARMLAKNHAHSKVRIENGKPHTVYQLTITGYNIALIYDFMHFPSPVSAGGTAQS